MFKYYKKESNSHHFKKNGHLWADYYRFRCTKGGFGMYTVEKDM